MILEGGGLQLSKIGAGQRKLKGGQPRKAGAVVWQWVAIPSKRQSTQPPHPFHPWASGTGVPDYSVGILGAIHQNKDGPCVNIVITSRTKRTPLETQALPAFFHRLLFFRPQVYESRNTWFLYASMLPVVICSLKGAGG